MCRLHALTSTLRHTGAMVLAQYSAAEDAILSEKQDLNQIATARKQEVVGTLPRTSAAGAGAATVCLTATPAWPEPRPWRQAMPGAPASRAPRPALQARVRPSLACA